MKQNKTKLGVSCFRTRRAGFLLIEAILALGLVGAILFLVAKFEHSAAVMANSLEQEYVATVAAETQFERLKAGLAVLDSKTFRQRYPGLSLDYHLQPGVGAGMPVGVVTIRTEGSEPRVLVKLVGPAPQVTPQSGVKTQ